METGYLNNSEEAGIVLSSSRNQDATGQEMRAETPAACPVSFSGGNMDNRIFSTQRALELGLEEAIVLETLEAVIEHFTEDPAIDLKFGLKIERKMRREQGHKWVRLSIAEMHFLFPWWSLKQIRRIVDRLLAKEELKTEKFDSKEFSQTKYYATVERI